MGQEEKIIAGTYCYRPNLRSDWHPMTNEQLTKKVLALQDEVKSLESQLEECQQK